MPTLVLTVHGPFGYAENLERADSITIMAPMCPQHKGGVSTIDQDAEYLFAGNGCNPGMGSKPAAKAHKYELKINAGNVTSQQWYGQGSVLQCRKPKKGLDAKLWRFWVTVPKPDAFVRVNPVEARINGSSTKPRNRLAVGIRLIYNQWNGTDVAVWLNGKPATDKDDKPVIFKFKNLGEPNHWDMEIEYAGSVRDDPEHEDAVTCFANLMRCLGLNWTIGFPGRDQVEVRPRNDCKAAVAWVK